MKNKSIIEFKDLTGIYDYIINNLSNEGIVNITRMLLNYTKGKENKIDCFGTDILELAMREEVKYILSNMENEKLATMSKDKFNEIVLTITYRLVYKNESVWETIKDFVSWEVEDILESEVD